MDTLVAVGSTASIVYGIFATIMIIIGLKNMIWIIVIFGWDCHLQNLME